METIRPDTWGHVQPLLDRPGNQDIQLALFYSYGSNFMRQATLLAIAAWDTNCA